LLDLFCEQTEMWRETQAFYGKPWLWCNIQSFGANTDMHGALNRINIRLDGARKSEKSGERRGLGFVNEGFEGNPVVYEFLLELAWQEQVVDLQKWLADYVLARYGIEDENIGKAWVCFLASVYSDWPRSGTFQSVNRFPRLNLPAGPPFQTEKVVEAWGLLLEAADKLNGCDTYHYDLVSTGIQVLADYSYKLQQKLLQSFKDKKLADFENSKQMFLELLEDIERLAASHRQFLLGRWLADARRWGETEQEKNRLEWNARRILTVWGSGNNIRDYSRRNWAGMFSGFYRPRWEKFMAAMRESLEKGTVFDEEKINQQLLEWERAWTEKHENYAEQVRGNYVEVSRQLWEKYKTVCSEN
jgi:alpha-N-acetylglucosaminidase